MKVISEEGKRPIKLWTEDVEDEGNETGERDGLS